MILHYSFSFFSLTLSIVMHHNSKANDYFLFCFRQYHLQCIISFPLRLACGVNA